jgi:hypothetical protein
MVRRYVGLIGVAALLSCSDTSEGQAVSNLAGFEETSSVSESPSPADPLFAIIGQLTARAIKEEDESSLKISSENNVSASDSYRYIADRIEIDRGDFDQDGDVDAAVTIYTCEEVNCHPTTISTRIAFISLDNGHYKLKLYRRFNLRAKINNLWAQDGVEVEVNEYGPDDPSCCPTNKSQTIIMFPDK